MYDFVGQPKKYFHLLLLQKYTQPQILVLDKKAQSQKKLLCGW